MFVDIMKRINDPETIKVIACLFNKSTEQISLYYKEKKLLENRFLFAWIPSDKIVAVCDYEVNKSGVHILQITTCKSTRGQGIGRNMIAALREQHQLPISALTDDNAVAFFCKCGFTVTPIKLLDGKWECWLR